MVVNSTFRSVTRAKVSSRFFSHASTSSDDEKTSGSGSYILIFVNTTTMDVIKHDIYAMVKTMKVGF